MAVTGGGGFLGRPTVALLEDLGAEVRAIRSAEYDLRDRAACFEALAGAQVVIHLAANVGGIGYNRRNPGPLAHDNLAMGLNVFEACRELEIEKLVAACSVCAYPKFTPVPFSEDDIWDGYPGGVERALRAGEEDAVRPQRLLPPPVRARLLRPGDGEPLRPRRQLRSGGLPRDRGDGPQVRGRRPSAAIPRSSSGGPGSPRGSSSTSTTPPAHSSSAPSGSRSPTRSTSARARRPASATSPKRSRELAGFEGKTVWDDSRPDGQPKRYLDVTRARELIGFEAETPLAEGLRRTIESFRAADLAPAGSSA